MPTPSNSFRHAPRRLLPRPAQRILLPLPDIIRRPRPHAVRGSFARFFSGHSAGCGVGDGFFDGGVRKERGEVAPEESVGEVRGNGEAGCRAVGCGGWGGG